MKLKWKYLEPEFEKMIYYLLDCIIVLKLIVLLLDV